MQNRISQLLLSASAIAIAATGVTFTSISSAEAAIDELVVTARKREENIQSVPLSVSAFSGDVLESQNLSSLSDISQLVAGFEFDQSFQRTFERPVIRGKSTIFTNAGGVGVSYFVNGVYYEDILSSIDTSDIERVEIIKGPQSALFGRNTYSGAINIITKKPGDEWKAKGSVSFAEHDEEEYKVSLSGPIIEGKLAGGVYFKHSEYGGEHVNQFDGQTVGYQETDSLSGTLRFTPTDTLEINARAHFSKIDDGPLPIALMPFSDNNYAERTAFYVNKGNRESVGGFDYFRGTLPSDLPVNSNNFLATIQGDPGLEREQRGGSLSIEWDLSDSLKLTSISGFDEFDTLHFNETSSQPGGGLAISASHLNAFTAPPYPADLSDTYTVALPLLFPTAEEGDQQTYNQDLRLEYDDGGRVRALIGASYYSNKASSENLFDADALSTPENNAAFAALTDDLVLSDGLAKAILLCNTIPGCDSTTGTPSTAFAVFNDNISVFSVDPSFVQSKTENWGVYGRVEVDITDKLTAGLGIRYAEDKKFARNTDDIYDAPTLLFEADEKFISTTPRLTVDYQLNDDSLLYFVAANGTKPGGFNAGAAAIGAGLTSFDEEEIWSFEVGSKNTFADGQLRFNAAAFYEEISDYQLTTTVVDGFDVGSAIDNKGEAEIWGLELDAVYAPASIEGLTLNMNYAYTTSELKGEDNTEGALQDVLDDGIRNCSQGLGNALLPCFHSPSLSNPVGEYNGAPADFEGRRLPLSAEHTISAGVNYTAPFSNMDADWFIGSNVSYESEKFVQIQNLALIPESTVVNFNAGISNENYTLSLWGKNIFDEDAPASGTRFISAQDFFRRAFQTFKRRGEQWGVTLTASF